MKAALLLPALLLTAAPALAQPAAAPSAPPSLLASAVVAGLVSAAVSGVVSLLIKDKEYKNDYFKKVIDKRIKAVEAAEELISLFTPCHDVGADELCHSMIVNDADNHEKYNALLEEISKYSIWLSTEAKTVLQKFADRTTALLVQCEGKNTRDREKIGAKNYSEILSSRRDVERVVRDDMASLHKVRRFFKRMVKDPDLLPD